MIRRALASLLVAATLTAPGCASVYGTFTGDAPGCASVYGTFTGDAEGPYAGVRVNVALMPYVLPLCLIDLPFSFALDTALLPFTVWTGLEHGDSYEVPDAPRRRTPREATPRPASDPPARGAGYSEGWRERRPFDAPPNLTLDLER